jgi:putative ABC transport system permease protein
MRISIVAQELRTQARRYALVGVSMLLGVVGVVGIALANSVASDMLVAQEEQLNGREATFEAEIRAGDDASGAALDALGHPLFEQLRQSAGPGLEGLTVEISLPAKVASADQARDLVPGVALTSHWVIGDPTSIRRMPVLDGDLPEELCFPGQVMLNQAAKAATGAGLGDVLVLTLDSPHQPRRVVVTSIVADGESQPNVYAPWSTLECAFPELATLDDAVIRLVAPARSLSTLQQLVAAPLADRGLAVEGSLHRVDTVASVRTQIETLSQIFTACAVLLLVVSALGIASVGLASVSERARELVVRRAFGATRGAIFVQVILGALIVGTIVGLVAFALAIAGTYLLLPALIPAATSIVAPPFPVFASLAGVAAALLTSLIGGAAPAIKATRLPIAHALRD